MKGHGLELSLQISYVAGPIAHFPSLPQYCLCPCQDLLISPTLGCPIILQVIGRQGVEPESRHRIVIFHTLLLNLSELSLFSQILGMTFKKIHKQLCDSPEGFSDLLFPLFSLFLPLSWKSTVCILKQNSLPHSRKAEMVGRILKDSTGKGLRGIINREEKNTALDILKDIKIYPCK